MKQKLHILRSDQPEIDRAFLDRLCRLTNNIRKKYGSGRDGVRYVRDLLVGKRAMLYFEQPSTRTFLSFESAVQNMGMDVVEIRNVQTSSAVKGESDMDAFRTFSSYADVVIIRSKDAELAQRVADHFDSTMRPIPVISAGSGTEHHPTQALLDIYTLHRSMRKVGGIDGKTIALVGDLLRGRTIHSLCHLLSNYRGVKLLLVSPPELSMPQEILAFLNDAGIQYEVTEDFDAAVAEANAIYMTRCQNEYGGVGGEDSSARFRFEKRHLDMLRPWAFVMHPLPRRDEIDPACDNDERVMIWRQARNGMWVRSALLYMMLWQEDELRSN